MNAHALQESVTVDVGATPALIDDRLRRAAEACGEFGGLREMVDYHLGFLVDSEGARAPVRRGKRIRAVLGYQIASAMGAPKEAGLTLAAAIELMHAASLVHDDIQDGDELRWNRETVWKRYGVPHAINVGDALIALTYQTIAELGGMRRKAGATGVLTAEFSRTHLLLTEGQYLDMAMEGTLEADAKRYYRVPSRIVRV